MFFATLDIDNTTALTIFPYCHKLAPANQLNLLVYIKGHLVHLAYLNFYFSGLFASFVFFEVGSYNL